MKTKEWKEFAEMPEANIANVLYTGDALRVCTSVGNVVVMSEEAYAALIEKTGGKYDWVHGGERKSR